MPKVYLTPSLLSSIILGSQVYNSLYFGYWSQVRPSSNRPARFLPCFNIH